MGSTPIEHGQHVFRAYWKHAWVKQYEKFRTFLRMEVTSNNLRDFKLHKGLAYLGEVRQRLYQVVDRFAAQQAVNLNVHDDFVLLRRIALPVETDGRKTAGIRVQDVRMIRLLEVLLHAGSSLGGWTAREIYAAVLDRFEVAPPPAQQPTLTTCGNSKATGCWSGNRGGTLIV